MNDDAVYLPDRIAQFAGKSGCRPLAPTGGHGRLWERCLPAKNDDAVCLPDRVDLIAGKHRSHRVYDCLLERGLPAMNDDAVCLPDRGALIAGKHRSHRGLRLSVGARLARDER